MKLAVERQERFSRGMNSLSSPTEYRADELAYLLNGELSLDGFELGVRKGSTRTHPAALNNGAQGYGGREFRAADGTHQIVTLFGDRAYYSEDEGATWTQVASGLPTGYWDFTTMRVGADNKLICANGGTSVYAWDGTTWAALANIPTGVRFVEVFNGRLYVAGHDGINVAASRIGDPENWTLPAAFEVPVQTHDGDSEIKGLYQIGSVILVFKRQSTNYIDGFGYQTLQVEAGSRGVSRSVGCVGFRTIQAVSDQAVCWLSERGIEHYQLGGPIRWVSRPIQPQMDALAWSNLIAGDGIAHAVYLPQENQYRLAVPTSGTATDLVIVYRPPTETAPGALWLRTQLQEELTGQTVFVDENGYLQFSNTPDRERIAVIGGYMSVGGPEATTYVELV